MNVITSSMPVTDSLVQRFFDQLIGVNPDKKRLGYQIRAGQPQSERTLLDIEAQAQKQRMAGAQAKAQFTEFAQAHLHDEVSDELVRRLHNIEHVMASLFYPTDAYYRVLDVLSGRTVTVNKLDPLVSRVPWLVEDLLRLVNQPQYRNRTSSGAMVKDIKTALRFLGVESLQLILPVYAMKRMMPHSTDPFTGLKSRLWDYSLAVAIAAKRLAEDSPEHPYNAFCVGLFHTLGHAVVTRNYLRTYQQVRQQQLLQARESRDVQLTDALDSLEPDGSFLSESFNEFAAVLSADITSRWQLDTLPLCQTLDQLAEGAGFAGSSPLARLVQQAQVYVQCRELKQRQQVSEDEAKAWFASVQLSSDSIQILRQTNLKRLGVEI
ncbi:HDOD domain-containing protein [Rheinheimera aquimaris]|uniref:HDOD domain-containing protein n=1 Tax=Rheinheimera aquimaris TaxID=412437 RepID=UPI001E2A72AB|nr:HDOD domain-containing protein [Rheinheimera aquimaris]